MADSQEEYYRRLILDHGRSPRNFGELPDASHQCMGHNPGCGDNIHLALKISPDSVIEAVRFRASGSALSKASASLMTSVIQGKTVEEVKLLSEKFHHMVTGVSDEKDRVSLGVLQAFSGVEAYPERVKCATLPWHALKGALENRGMSFEDIPTTTLVEESVKADEELDLSGVRCPINYVKVKVRMSKMQIGQKIRVVLDEGEPIRNVPRSLEMDGQKILSKQPVVSGGFAIVVEKLL
jgi:nitrogen fixation NifU-like protein